MGYESSLPLTLFAKAFAQSRTSNRVEARDVMSPRLLFLQSFSPRIFCLPFAVRSLISDSCSILMSSFWIHRAIFGIYSTSKSAERTLVEFPAESCARNST
jgi:hypothetical protein